MEQSEGTKKVSNLLRYGNQKNNLFNNGISYLLIAFTIKTIIPIKNTIGNAIVSIIRTAKTPKLIYTSPLLRDNFI